MNLLLYAALLLLSAITINGNPACRQEVTKYTKTHLACISNALEVQKLTNQIASNEISLDTVDIAALCAAANSTHCYNQVSRSIPRRCDRTPALQHVRNAFKILTTFNEYICQENGMIFEEFLRDGGAQCYFSQEKAQCYEEGKRNARVSGTINSIFVDENVCKILQADWDCLQHYDSCENPNVKEYYAQVVLSMKSKMNC